MSRIRLWPVAACIIMVLAAAPAFSQFRTTIPAFQARQPIITQTARPDLFPKSQPNEASLPGHKSPFLAAALSAVIPGLGEYYVGDKNWWHGLIFTGLEAGLWLEYSHWLSRFNDSTAAFHTYSDAHWSLRQYSGYMDSILTADTQRVRLFGNRLSDYRNPGSVNNAEALLDSLSVYGSDPHIKNFTHRLTFDDQQQYYELISKYQQYFPGWDDAWHDLVADVWHSNHADRASEMRANMNNQYGIASYFLWGIIGNHILSAIDAAILASDHNAKLRLHGEIIRRPNSYGSVDYVPTANVEYRF